MSAVNDAQAADRLSRRQEWSRQIESWVRSNREEAYRLASELVRIPSVNHPPKGNEGDYQRFFAEWMVDAGAIVDSYELSEVAGLTEHRAYMPGRDYENRPNVAGCFFGKGEGRSLLFSGHADTVYEGDEKWSHSPFSGTVEDGKLYGRGSYDMKGGMAAALMAVKCLSDLGLPVAGKVYIESVVDEEHGGANGSLAARLRGPQADMAIIPEPSNLKLYPAHIGGGIWRAVFQGKSGIGFAGEELVSALEATLEFANMLRDFGAYRKERMTVPHWWEGGRLPEVTLLTMFSGDINRLIQEKLPASGALTFWIEGFPGTTGEEIMNELQAFYDARRDQYPLLGTCWPEITPLIRYLEGSEMEQSLKTDEFLTLVGKIGENLGGAAVPVEGSPFACDAFMFNLYSDTPALVLGPGGANAHAADEYMDLASYTQLIQWYAEIIVDWCGVQGGEEHAAEG
ncbi:M20/M25/M40 family metallo-hydrolase [Paenibacillus sp. J5C_2022]|uniref:M20/M25/M40 family metallo-hydrolase n=1 Tax=Paenibacillus sp. J5C2022 TaxID=2977129 RepID=UPI0021CEB3DC|nr:M20/M25/M40 family metallo-hydrolase [Paenibacillus sp. J5C2022]MCU6712170.1 M20/M25/M40 family metallo-hydrolase [Paenibacillus sp. J5C2022]